MSKERTRQDAAGQGVYRRARLWQIIMIIS